MMGSGEEGTRGGWGGRDEGKKRWKKCESDKKAIARELLSAAAIFHYAALRRRTQSSIFSRPRLAPTSPPHPPKAIITPLFFLRCFAMRKMKPRTYQLSAHTSDWGVRKGTMRLLFTFYLQ